MEKFSFFGKIKKNINYLFFMGVFFISLALVLRQINTNSQILIIGITTVGMTLIIGAIIIFLYTNKSFFGKRGVEVSTNAIVSIFALLLILSLVNFLALKYSIKIDLTETKLYTLSPQSQQLVSNLSQPLKVYVFQSSPQDFDRQLLQDYARKNQQFQYQFIDPQVNINLAQKFNVTRLGDVYLEYGDKQQLVQTLSPDNPLSEIKLTNAIAQIQQTEQPIIYILQGHGEPTLEEGKISLSQAVNTLKDKGYIINPLTLATSPLIPPDANVLVIINPEKELLQGEIKIIQKYIEEGGNLLIMYNAQTNVNLDQILTSWGVKFDDRLIVDASGTGEILNLGPSTTIIVEYGQHPITQDFNNGMTIFPLARAIITNTNTVDNIITTPLLITNSLSWAENNPEGENVELDFKVDLPGPLNIGVALSKKNPLIDSLKTQDKTLQKNNDKSEQKSISLPLKDKIEENKSTLPLPPIVKIPENETQNIPKKEKSLETRIVVIGNANFATDGWFQQQLNSDLFVNTIGWLGNQNEKNLSISPKEATNRRINLNTLQITLIGWLALIIIPLLGFTASLLTWWQRSR